MNDLRWIVTVFAGLLGVALLLGGTVEGRWIGVAACMVALLVKPSEATP